MKTRIKPPAEITGESRDEWFRMVKSLESLGRTVDLADVSILSLYCRAWGINRTCWQEVEKSGATVKRPSGAELPSPAMRGFLETTKLLRGILADLQATPASRKSEEVEPPPLD